MKDKPLNEKVEKCEVDEGGSENNYDWVYWEDVKEAVEKWRKKILSGCGKEFLDESGDWELMCGKHIWKDKGVVKEYRLCEDCIEELEEFNKIFGDFK